MTAEHFNPDEWILGLSEAVVGVAATQESYRDELYRLHQSRTRRETEPFPPIAPYHPSEILSSLYWQACSGTSRYDEQHYRPLRAALSEARRVLATHSALTDLVDLSDAKADFPIYINDRCVSGTLSGIVAGLVARGLEIREHGFKVAATELNALLNPLDSLPPTSAFDDLSTGFHVVLLHGLRIDEETPVADDTAIVPFERLDPLVNRGVIRDVAPKIIRYRAWKSVAALVKPFRWRPEFHKSNKDFDPELDWGGSFFEDAQALIELLALFHARPVIPLVTIPYCIHRTASHLLGQPHYHSGYRWGPSVRNFDALSGSSNLNREALNAARRELRRRDGDRYRNCEPVIARLAEALARSGRFQADDKILDVAIALEQMYELDGGEISFKLKIRAACFLETDTHRRSKVYGDVTELYEARSGIVHKRKRKHSPAKTKADAFNKGFDVARRSVVKLLNEGPPSDWNKMVIGGTEHPRGEPSERPCPATGTETTGS